MPGDQEQNRRVLGQFTRQAGSYARATASVKNSGLAERLAFLGPLPDDRVLDVACGTGNWALALAASVERVIGVDLTPAMLEQARAAQAARGVRNVEWRNGDALALPFADGAFSLVMCSAAFHHLADPATALAEMRRVCRDGGRVFVMDVTPALDKSAEFDRIEQLRDPSHRHALLQGELLALGRAACLEEVRCQLFATTLPLELVLSTSFPAAVTVEDIREAYRRDADSGEDRYGLGTCHAGEELLVTYPMTAALWRKPAPGTAR